MKSNITNMLTVFAGLLLFNACSPLQPALSIPPDLKKEPLAVKGRQGLLINQKLSFAEFQTSRVKRSWTKGGNSRVSYPIINPVNLMYIDFISKEYIDRNQTFSFQMSDSFNNQSDVYGASNFNAQNLMIGSNPNSIVNILEDIYGRTDFSENIFYLQVFLNDDTQPWELLLDNQASQANKKYIGFFAKGDDHYYTLKPLTKLETKQGPRSILMGSVGFEILNQDNDVIAAVSLIDSGLVYLFTEVPSERFLMANLCAALLLQENISQ